jgi:adenosine deaminase
VTGISEEFLLAVPKTDLHVHLDGSVRLATLIELAREQRIELPSYTEAGLRELVFKDQYASLSEYLRGFSYLVAVLQSEEALERAAYELGRDNQAEGVRYIEVRFAPQLHVHDGMDAVTVLAAVNRGLARAKAEFNARAEVTAGAEPPFEYGLICCALRMFRPEFSPYYRAMFDVHRFARTKDIFAMASLELARSAVVARDRHGLPVVGFDLAGEEAGYPAGDHFKAFMYCQRNFLKKTVHAGEAYGPESIFQAITALHADRIGHGTYLLEADAITDASIVDREGYVRQLGEYISDRRITLEVCLTSNAQTNPQMRDVRRHSFRKMLEARLSATICTDNRTVSNTTVTRELTKAVRQLEMTRHQLKSVIIYGFKRSFFPGPYRMKRSYVRGVIDYYESIERRYLSA